MQELIDSSLYKDAAQPPLLVQRGQRGESAGGVFKYTGKSLKETPLSLKETPLLEERGLKPAHTSTIDCQDYGNVQSTVHSDRQIQALAAALDRLLDYQENQMRLKEQRRVDGLRKRYYRRYHKNVISSGQVAAVYDHRKPRQIELWAA